jgi:hypothetical protein
MTNWKAVEICPVGNKMPKHGPMLRDHRPVRTREDFEREIVGFEMNRDWDEAIAEMQEGGLESLWVIGKPLN